MFPRVAGSGVICQRWQMISVTHFEGVRCWLLFWSNTGGPLEVGLLLAWCVKLHLTWEGSEEQVWGLEMPHKPVLGGIGCGFGSRR